MLSVLIFQGINRSLAGETRNMFETEKKCVKSECKITKLVTHIYAVNFLEQSSR